MDIYTNIFTVGYIAPMGVYMVKHQLAVVEIPLSNLIVCVYT